MLRRVGPPLALGVLVCASAACRATASAPEPRAARSAILVCGQAFETDAPVVSWHEGPRYDAYATTARFAESARDAPVGLRYRPGRAVEGGGTAHAGDASAWTLEELRERVDLLVLHYDACGTSRECFRVLHDQRGLSIHFLLDVDGTVYQTLDLREQAWHARRSNPRSIGVEIAQIGAYPPDEAGTAEPLGRWYAEERDGVRLRIPSELGDGGVATPGFRGRPARPNRIAGEIQGRRLVQYDFTPEQYESLAALTATLVELFPRIEPVAPRESTGAARAPVRSSVLSETELAAFGGIVGHYHVSAEKVDPGPAFDWERYLAEVRARLR